MLETGRVYICVLFNQRFRLWIQGQFRGPTAGCLKHWVSRALHEVGPQDRLKQAAEGCSLDSEAEAQEARWTKAERGKAELVGLEAWRG